MPRTLPPPQALDDFTYFILAWSREAESFAMTLPNGRSYDLGGPEEARAYLRDTLCLGGTCGLGERAMNSAMNWTAVVVIPATEQCYAADTEGGERIMGAELFRPEDDPRDDVALIGVPCGLPGYI